MSQSHILDDLLELLVLGLVPEIDHQIRAQGLRNLFVILLDRGLVDEFPGPHEVNEDLPEGGVGLEDLDAQLVEVEDVADQGSNQTEQVSVEEDLVVQHEHFLLFGPQFQVHSGSTALVLRVTFNVYTIRVLSTDTASRNTG